MQTARYFVRTFVEFTAGMQNRKYYFECRFVFFLVHVDRDTPAVVGYGYGVVFVDENVDAGTVAGQCFVDGVVDHFIY